MASFSSMPNFRPLVTVDEGNIYADKEADGVVNKEVNDACNRIASVGIVRRKGQKTGKIYRSSRPDFLTEEDIEIFQKIDFKSIIDFRSYGEYKRSHHEKLIDQHYPLYKVKIPVWRCYEPYEDVNCVSVAGQQADCYSSLKSRGDDVERKHFLINFFNLNLVWEIYNRVSIFWRIVALFYLLVDVVLNNDKKYFVRLFAKKAINKLGLVGQYIDIIEHSKSSICAALKLLCDPTNIPVMLNCAHGKDRTGIVSAFVLSCLGHSRDHICADYARSSVELESVQDLLERDIVGRYHLCRSFMGADGQTMREALEYVDNKYGSVSDYLTNIGFSLREQQQLRDNLMD